MAAATRRALANLDKADLKGLISDMCESPDHEAPETDAEFQRVLRNLVNTPHKPHEKAKPSPKNEGTNTEEIG